MLWFDVGFKRYTTTQCRKVSAEWLWFDVGFKRYTTGAHDKNKKTMLWFDVGFKRYTTEDYIGVTYFGCGLM